MMTRQLSQNSMTVLDNDIVKLSDVLEQPEGSDKKAKKKNKQTKLDEFLMNLNALLNGGGGSLIVHVENMYTLDKFEQRVNYHMANLIPDDSPFHENYERHIEGMNHLSFRVIPKDERPLSTAFFNTKVPQSCGVVNPTQRQMKYLMEHQGVQRDDSQNEVRYTFKNGYEVKVKIRIGTSEDSVFQEAINVQAKKVSKEAIIQFQSNLESEFFNRDKQSTYLPKYVSAFTKLPKGGSIFLGIKEGDTEEDHGKFLCEGVNLKPGHQKAVSQNIKDLIKENTYWLLPVDVVEPSMDVEQPPMDVEQPSMDVEQPSMDVEQSPVDVVQPPVDVEQKQVDDVQKHVDVVYHRVEGTPDLCVVEVKVHRYEGMVFHDKAGPEAYTFEVVDDDGYAELEPMSLETWSEKIKK